MSQRLLLRGGRVVDPSMSLDGRTDVRIREGFIAGVGALQPEVGERVLEIDGLTVIPGLIDVHTHLREPGQEWKETLGTGTASAAAGGFTTIFCMPNTDPPLDSVAMLEELHRRAARDSIVHVFPIATISEGRRGERPADYAALARAGAVGFSDDGESTADSAIMRAALAATRQHGRPVMVHCEDPALIGGAMHEGEVSRALGIPGIAAAAEEIFIGRDLALAEATGGWLHVLHVSTAHGADAVLKSRQRGARVTAEVMPHHLMMTDSWVAGNRTMCDADVETASEVLAANADTKVNPPLRPAQDARALLAALQQGNIGVVATDHAPHALPEKRGRPFGKAAFGLHGSEVALPIMLTLVRAGALTLNEVIAAMSTVPACLWRLPGGALRLGAPADIAILDPDEQWTVAADRLLSRGVNTPLLNMTMRGRVKLTLVGGDERYRDW